MHVLTLAPKGISSARSDMISGNDYSNLMTVDSVSTGDSVVMYLVGECDIGTVPALTQELRRALAECKHVVLDVHLLTYIDSTGISVIASAQESLAQSKRQLRIVGAHGILDRIIRLMKLDGQIPLDDNVDDALAAVAKL
jgi:anti-anti-sigma factor